MIEIRKAEKMDFEQIWSILREVFSKGDTYTFAPDTSKEEMLLLCINGSVRIQSEVI